MRPLHAALALGLSLSMLPLASCSSSDDDDQAPMVVFNDSKDPTRPAWQHFMWDYIVDTDYNITDKSQFSCAFYRGDDKNPLYFLNEFIHKDLGSGLVVPDKLNAAVANERSFVVERYRQRRRETGRFPVFVYVDWFGQGDPKGAVDDINADGP